MSNSTSDLLMQKPATELLAGRALAHRAVQHLTGLARANIEAKPDDSHSNLGWDAQREAFSTHPIGNVTATLKLSPLTLSVVDGSNVVNELALSGKTVAETEIWIDQAALALGLSAPSSASIPYEFPDDVAAIESYDTDACADQLAALTAWFGLALDVLENLKSSASKHQPGPSPVRCWPHHFDIATYISFEDGDPETARGMGVGLSPGDEGHGEPYFYINPWPHLDRATLPEAVAPGYWHVDGYVGLVATATALQETGAPAGSASDFITDGFKAAFDAQWPN